MNKFILSLTIVTFINVGTVDALSTKKKAMIASSLSAVISLTKIGMGESVTGTSLSIAVFWLSMFSLAMSALTVENSQSNSNEVVENVQPQANAQV